MRYALLFLLIMWMQTASVQAQSPLEKYDNCHIDIPDNGNSVNSELILTDESVSSYAKIVKVWIYYEIRHTYPGDLDVWVTNYHNDKWNNYFLYNQGDLGGTDDIVEIREEIHNWDGFPPNLDWYLVVQDKASGDIGYIDFFEIKVYYEEREDIKIYIKDENNDLLSTNEINSVMLLEDDGTLSSRINEPGDNPVNFENELLGTYFADVYCWDMLAVRSNTINHNGVTSVDLNTYPKRDMDVTVLYDGGTTPIVGAELILYSYNGENGNWNERSSKITNEEGKATFNAWPTTLYPDEKYKIEIIKNGENIDTRTNINLENTEEGSSYIFETTQSVPAVSVTVNIVDNSDNEIDSEEINAIIIFDSSSGEEVSRLEDIESLPAIFNSIEIGNYFIDVYCWDMLAVRSDNFQLTEGVNYTTNLETIEKGWQKINVFYDDGITPLANAKVVLESYNGQFDDWTERALAYTNEIGQVSFLAWPTTLYPDEKYKVIVYYNDNLVGINSNLEIKEGLFTNEDFNITTSVENFFDAEIISYNLPQGTKERGNIITVDVLIENTGSENHKFWIGLSLAPDDVSGDDWPIGWYDVYPKQSSELAPSQQETIQFRFDIPDWLRPAQYKADIAVWHSYNSEKHIMLPERTPFDAIRGQSTFDLGVYEFSPGSIVEQLLEKARRTRTWQGIEGDLWEKYNDGEKMLFFIAPPLEFMIGGMFLIDLADLAGVTPEGQDEWVTMWIDGSFGVSAGVSPITFGVKSHFFENPNNADNRVHLHDDLLNLNFFGSNVTIFHSDNTNNEIKLLEWATDFETDLSISILTYSIEGLISYEVKREKLIQLINNGFQPGIGHAESIKELYLLIKNIIDDGSLGTDYRFPATIDDGNWKPDTPFNIFPANEDTNIYYEPLFECSRYFDKDGDLQELSEWQISLDELFTNITHELDGLGNSVELRTGALEAGTEYYWRVRFKDNRGAYSEWSLPTCFITTSNSTELPIVNISAPKDTLIGYQKDLDISPETIGNAISFSSDGREVFISYNDTKTILNDQFPNFHYKIRREFVGNHQNPDVEADTAYQFIEVKDLESPYFTSDIDSQFVEFDTSLSNEVLIELYKPNALDNSELDVTVSQEILENTQIVNGLKEQVNYYLKIKASALDPTEMNPSQDTSYIITIYDATAPRGILETDSLITVEDSIQNYSNSEPENTNAISMYIKDKISITSISDNSRLKIDTNIVIYSVDATERFNYYKSSIFLSDVSFNSDSLGIVVVKVEKSESTNIIDKGIPIKEMSYILFPDHLQIIYYSDKYKDETFSVYNIMGKALYRKQTISNSGKNYLNIDRSTLEKGIIIIKRMSDNSEELKIPNM